MTIEEAEELITAFDHAVRDQTALQMLTERGGTTAYVVLTEPADAARVRMINAHAALRAALVRGPDHA